MDWMVKKSKREQALIWALWLVPRSKGACSCWVVLSLFGFFRFWFPFILVSYSILVSLPFRFLVLWNLVFSVFDIFGFFFPWSFGWFAISIFYFPSGIVWRQGKQRNEKRKGGHG